MNTFFGREILAKVTDEIFVTNAVDEYDRERGARFQITTGSAGANMLSTSQPLTCAQAIQLGEALIAVGKAQALRDLVTGS